MMGTKRIFVYASVFSGFLVACSQIPKEAYFSRGQPESLIDVSSEVVDLHIDSPSSLREITHWINKDQPTRAELTCMSGEKLCKRAQNILHQFGVPVKYTSSGENNVTLIYERMLTRDCENRYIDNTINPYNLNHPTFGCSMAVNMVQMVSDKRQFTNPSLSDYSDAEKGVQSIENYKQYQNFDPNFEALATQSAISSTGSGGSR